MLSALILLENKLSDSLSTNTIDHVVVLSHSWKNIENRHEFMSEG